MRCGRLGVEVFAVDELNQMLFKLIAIVDKLVSSHCTHDRIISVTDFLLLLLLEAIVPSLMRLEQ